MEVVNHRERTKSQRYRSEEVSSQRRLFSTVNAVRRRMPYSGRTVCQLVFRFISHKRVGSCGSVPITAHRFLSDALNFARVRFDERATAAEDESTVGQNRQAKSRRKSRQKNFQIQFRYANSRATRGAGPGCSFPSTNHDKISPGKSVLSLLLTPPAPKDKTKKTRLNM